MNYIAVHSNRLFRVGVYYWQIDWTKLHEIIDQFHDRLIDWYIGPAESLKKPGGHFAFAALSLSCTLIDTLSQYWKGSPFASKTLFKDFLTTHVPEFNQTLPIQITHHYYQNGTPATNQVKNYADALYSAYRCGIVHESHVTPYGRLEGGSLVAFQPSGFVEYADRTPCPSVTIDPWELLERLNTVFVEYIAKLKDKSSANNVLRTNFKVKFSDCFGVDISGAT